MEASTTQPAEPAAEPQEPTQPEAPEQESASDPDLREAVTNLTERIDRLSPPPEEVVADPLAAYLGTEEPEEPEQPEGEPQYGEDPNAALYEDPVSQEVQQMRDYLIAKEEEALEARFSKAVTDYPDLAKPEVVQKVRTALAPLASRYGDEVYADPDLVVNAYKTLRADEESAKETPAEEAVSGGATLETGAGPGNQEPDPSYSDAKGDAIVNSGVRKSAFT